MSMKVYHSSSVRVVHPDVTHSRKFLDFGQGFYLTTLRDQATKYAQRFLRRGKDAWLNIYELDDSFLSYKIKVFDGYDEEWLDYVAACRDGRVVDDWDVFYSSILMTNFVFVVRWY